jgi:hypothetical protein
MIFKLAMVGYNASKLEKTLDLLKYLEKQMMLTKALLTSGWKMRFPTF